jgi:hypothetical protein
MLVGSVASVYYLHALKYRNKQSSFTKIHNFLNKSFKLRNSFSIIKFPRISFANFVKNFKLAS